MKKKEKTSDDMEMRSHYDFSKGIRGKHAAEYNEGTNIVVLDPDIAKVFPDSNAVNKALRGLLDIIKLQKKATN